MQAALATESISEKQLREEVVDVLRENAGKLLEVGLSEQQVEGRLEQGPHSATAHSHLPQLTSTGDIASSLKQA